MAKYIEVVKGDHKGLKCFVRSANDTSIHYSTFSGLELNKADCIEIAYEKHWIPEKDRGCRGER